MTAYAIKLGDNDPALDFVCVGTDGNPVDLTGVTEMKVAVRRAGTSEYVVEKVTPDDVVVLGDPADGTVRVIWGADDTTLMGEGDMEFECQVVRGGRITTFPSEGYGVFQVWEDIAPEPGEES